MDSEPIKEEELDQFFSIATAITDVLSGRAPSWAVKTAASALRQVGMSRGARLILRVEGEDDFQLDSFSYLFTAIEYMALWGGSLSCDSPESEREVVLFVRNSILFGPAGCEEFVDELGVLEEMPEKIVNLGNSIKFKARPQMQSVDREAMERGRRSFEDDLKGFSSAVFDMRFGMYLLMTVEHRRIERMESVSDVYDMLRGRGCASHIDLDAFRRYCGRIGLSFKNRAKL